MTHTGLCSPDHVTAAKKPRNRSTRRCVQCLRQAGTERWFAEDPTFDSDFRQRSKPPHFAAAARELDDCVDTAEGALALMGHLDRVSEEQLRQHPAYIRHRQAGAALCPCRSNKSSGCSSIFRSSTPKTLRMRIARFASATRHSMLKRLDMPTFTRTSSPRA